MIARMMLIAVAVLLAGHSTVLAQGDFEPRGGDYVVICLAGNVAERYAATTEAVAHWPEGSMVETLARINRVLPDGRFEIEHSSSIAEKEGVTRLVTLSATIAPDDPAITVARIPAGKPVFAAPGEDHPVATTGEESETVRITLSSQRGIRLRTWVLADDETINR